VRDSLAKRFSKYHAELESSHAPFACFYIA
jgi:hypothetical protein